jgi:hypothetical protein
MDKSSLGYVVLSSNPQQEEDAMNQNQAQDCDTLGRLLGIAFAGLHLPLLIVGIAFFFGGVTDTGDLVLAALVGTLAAAVFTLGAMWRIIGPSLIAQHARSGHSPHVLAAH